MRISDWSSDVCSSDLSLKIKERNAIMATERFTGSQTDTVLSDIDLRDKEFYALKRTSTGGTLCGAGDHCDGVISERSEEHTSELQSLMRISYAVFCLKKKK